MSDKLNPDQTIEPEIGPGTTSDDSAYGDEVSAYSASVTSSIYNYPTKHGRTYHAYQAGRYVLPNDESELDRLDIHHHLILRAMKNKLYNAPLSENFSGRVLDLATGTGIWPIEFADIHPSATIIGNDLSPTQPAMIPPNVSFYVDDIEADWTYAADEGFDFIHARYLAGTIGDWPSLMSKCFTHTKPGGYVEFHDWDTRLYAQDGTLSPESTLVKAHSMVEVACEAQGFIMRPGPSLAKYLKDAGFVDVSVSKVDLPLGPWPKDAHLKEIGVLNLIQMLAGIEGMCLGTLTKLPEEHGGPWTYDQVQSFLEEIRKEMRDKRIHGMYDFYAVHGRKPEA